MPSKAQANQQATEVPESPVTERDHGENPARYLVQEIEPDVGDGTSGQIIFARISGIDDIELCHAWMAVERRLAAEGYRSEPRDRVLDALEERIATLEEIGERPERLTYRPEPEPTESVGVFVDEDGNERDRSTFRSKRRTSQ